MKKMMAIVIAIVAMVGFANSQSVQPVSYASSVGLVCDWGCSEDGGVCLFNHVDCANDANNCGGIGQVCGGVGAVGVCDSGNCYLCTDDTGCVLVGNKLEQGPPSLIKMFEKRLRKPLKPLEL